MVLSMRQNQLAEIRARLNPPRSADDIARMVGCSGAQIRKLENGFVNPGLTLARKVAAALGVTLDEAFPPKVRRRRAA